MEKLYKLGNDGNLMTIEEIRENMYEHQISEVDYFLDIIRDIKENEDTYKVDEGIEDLILEIIDLLEDNVGALVDILLELKNKPIYINCIKECDRKAKERLETITEAYNIIKKHHENNKLRLIHQT